MIESASIYKVITPAGVFEVAFGDEDDPFTEFMGDDLAIRWFKSWISGNSISNHDGYAIDAGSLEPSDLYYFCQPPGSGITVIPPMDDLVSYALDDQPEEQEPEDMTTAILDAATGREALQLAKELKQIRESIAGLTGRAALASAKRIREIRVALGVGNNATEIIATFKDVEDNMEVRVAKISTGYSVTIKDLDSGEVSLFGNIYKDKDTAIKKAKEAARISETQDVGGDSKPQATIADVNAVMPLIKQFIGKSQLAAMGAGVRGEEGQFFKDKFVEVAKVIEGMPHTYQTDGQGDKAIAYLHYFKGGMDWYITEKDVGDAEDEKEGISGQVQAFGYADLGHGGELGYISIKELIESGVELDLYWSPKSIGEIKGKADPEPAKDKNGLSEVQKMKDAIISWGGEIALEMNESAIAFKLRGAEYSDIEPPYLKFNDGMYRVHYGDGFTDQFSDPWEAVEAYSIAKKQQANTMAGSEASDSNVLERYIEMSSDQIKALLQKDFDLVLSVFEEFNEHTEALLFSAKRTGVDVLIKRAKDMVQEQDASPDGVTMEFTQRRHELQKEIDQYLSSGETMTETGLQDPIKSAFIAELSDLKSETDIDAFNNRLDEIAGRIEQAGLMKELDAELNDAADVLTELLAKAENA